MTDEQERALYPGRGNDPSGDNFFFQRSNPPNLFDYYNINGTEGNAILTDIGRIPDTEDLNRSGNPDLANSYFRYEIPLDTNSQTNPFIAGGGFNPNPNKKWFLYRIPLKDYMNKIGEDASFSNVEFIRLFFHGVENMVHFKITEFNLVGNQWHKKPAGFNCKYRYCFICICCKP